MADDGKVATASFRRVESDTSSTKVTDKKDGDDIKLFQPGELLFKYGDEGGDLFFIKQGEVEVFRPDGGEEYHFCNMSVGEVLGVSSMLAKGKRAASVRALSEVKVQIVRHEKFQKMISECPKWLSSLVKDLGFRLEITNKSYIQKASRLKKLEKSKGSILKISAHIAKSMNVLGRLETTSIESKKVSPLGSILKNLTILADYPAEFLESISEIFRQSKLIEGENISGMIFLTKKDLANLAFYDTAVANLEGKNKSPKDFFSLNELDMLRAFAKTIESRESSLKQEIKVPIEDVIKSGKDFGPELIDKCVHRKLFALSGQANIQLTVSEFLLNINCLDAMLRIKKNLSEVAI